MRGFGKSECKFLLGSCPFSSRSNKRFKPISFSSNTRRAEEEEICSLPDELLSEVLEWLPIKSIIQFRLVSKSWSTLFKTPTFIRNHRIKQERSKCGTMLLLRRRYIPPDSPHEVLSFHDLDSPQLELRDRIPVLSLLKNLAGKELSILTHNNGILLGLLDGSSIILCNPALREFKFLPAKPWVANPHGYTKYICASGFSFSSSEDFKVILFYRFINPALKTMLPSAVAIIYNSRTNSWTRFDDSPLLPDPSVHADAIVLNGAWHWLGYSFSSAHIIIVSFDVTSEVVAQLELPDCLGRFNGSWSYPIVLNDCLGIVEYKQPCTDSGPGEVWVMNEYGVKESWNKLFIISPQSFATTYLPWKNDTLLLVQQPAWITLGTGEYDQLASINLHTGEMKKFQVFGTQRTLRGLIYEESLLSLN